MFKPNVATEGPKKLKAKGKKENTDIIEHQESEGKKIGNKSKKDKQMKEEVIFENDNEVLFGEDLEKDKDWIRGLYLVYSVHTEHYTFCANTCQISDLSKSRK